MSTHHCRAERGMKWMRRIVSGTLGVLVLTLTSATAQPRVPPSTGVDANEGSGDETAEPDDTTQPTPGVVAIGESTRLTFYGLLRLDAIIDGSRPNALQTPFFIMAADGRTSADRETSFTLHPRLSRLGTDFVAPRLNSAGGARLTGKLEIDFQNGGRESRAIPRFRHAFLRLEWRELEVLAGQTWDIISPLFPTVNADTLMWNAGNLGDRRPQVRMTYEHHKSKDPGVQLIVTVGAGLTGAVDGQDLDGDGVLDGEESGVPNAQARVALGFGRNARARRASIGVSSHIGRTAATMPADGTDRHTWPSHSVNLDYQVVLTGRMTARGELWTGKNLSDVRGGIGQSLRPGTADTISSRGGWSEIVVQVTTPYSMAAGYTLDDPRGNAPRTRNRAWYIVNQYRLGRPFLVGVDYLNWKTEYSTVPSGKDNRINVYTVFAF